MSYYFLFIVFHTLKPILFYLDLVNILLKCDQNAIRTDYSDTISKLLVDKNDKMIKEMYIKLKI